MMLHAMIINAMNLNAELLYNDCNRKKYVLHYSSLDNTLKIEYMIKNEVKISKSSFVVDR